MNPGCPLLGGAQSRGGDGGSEGHTAAGMWGREAGERGSGDVSTEL